MDPKATGLRIKSARNLKGLRQGDLAGTLGWNYVKLSKIENGRIKGVAVSDLIAISEALDVSLDYLLGRENENPEGNGNNNLDQRGWAEGPHTCSIRT